MSPQSPSQPQQTINHFSHHHPLHLSQIPTSHHLQPPSSCSACNHKTLEPIYTCTSCNFFLHKKCSQMPSKITHPFRKDHVFSLLVKPEYQGGSFTCDACGKLGQGFVYNCKSCNLDMHILCATMPLTLNCNSHFHSVELVFSPSYGDKRFNCDICNTQGLNHWLYSCRICGFDAHLDCANSQLQHPGMVSNGGGSSIPAPETATGIPLQQFMANQSFQSQIGINGSARNNEYMILRQPPAGGYHDSYNQNYMQAVTAGAGYGGGGGGIGGFGGGGGLGGGGGGGGGVGRRGGVIANGVIQFVIGALTGLPIGSLGGGGSGGHGGGSLGGGGGFGNNSGGHGGAHGGSF